MYVCISLYSDPMRSIYIMCQFVWCLGFCLSFKKMRQFIQCIKLFNASWYSYLQKCISIVANVYLIHRSFFMSPPLFTLPFFQCISLYSCSVCLFIALSFIALLLRCKSFFSFCISILKFRTGREALWNWFCSFRGRWSFFVKLK
jgi:hypothetical protein